MRKRLLTASLVTVAAIAFHVCSSMAYEEDETAAIPIPSGVAKVVKMSESRLLGAREVTEKKRPPERTWGRDPFELPLGVELRTDVEEESPKAVKASIKKVTAILITDSRKVASINHKVVAVGDLIDGERVLEIRPDRVILEKDGRRQVIILEESPIQWTKNGGQKHEE